MTEKLHTGLREYGFLLGALKRLRADTDPDEDDVLMVVKALERRLAKEEKERASNRMTQRRYRANKRKETAE